MVMGSKRVLLIAIGVAGLTAAPTLTWASGGSSGVVNAIEKKYVVTETSTDHEQVTKDGTTMVMKCAGVYSTPASVIAVPDNQVEDSKIKPLNFFLKSMYEKAGAHVLQTNDKVYITKIDSRSDPKGDLLKFTILTVEDIDSNGAQKKFGATLSFKFKKGYLDDTPPDDVEQAIEAILAPDTGSDDKKESDSGQSQAKASTRAAPQAAAPAPAPAPPPPAAPATPGATISIGESSTQVLQAMGMPLQMYDLGKKKTFVYKSMKIIFIDDKVSDVQ